MHGGDRYRNQVKMDFSVNINPFGMPMKVQKILRDAVGECVYYPDAHAEELKKALSAQYGVDENKILVGNGASELFAALFHALRPKQLLTHAPGFFGYRHAAEMVGCKIEEFLLTKENGFVLTPHFMESIDTSYDLVILTQPNNPTGKLIDENLLYDILEKTAKLCIPVLLDACFYELSGGCMKELAQWTKKYPQLIVIGAFTKNYGMPGIRLGYGIVGSIECKEKIQRQLPEWNVSYIAQKAGVAALNETEYLEETVTYLQKERLFFIENLKKLGIEVFATDANFILIKTEKPLYDLLLRRNILIRSCEDFTGLSEQYFRLCIKKREENVMLLHELEEIYGKD